MLRESTNEAGESINYKLISEGEDAQTGIPHAQLLGDFAAAVVSRDNAVIAQRRSKLVEAIGPAGLVDACAVAAAFHGFVRVADSTGIPQDDYRMESTAELREELGINDFLTAGT